MNIKRITQLLIMLMMMPNGGIAQQKQGDAGIPLYNVRTGNMGKPKVVDYTKIRVWYALNADKIDDMETYIDMQLLDIGDSITKYHSWFVLNSDSLIADFRKKNPNARGIPKWMGTGGKEPYRWCQYQWSDFYIWKGTLTEYASMPVHLNKYDGYYDEPYAQMQWTLDTEHQTIIGYDCQKATCHWRGRDYVAWFTLSVPVRQGPWKFGGLPGLILKVYDTEQVYTFEAVGIETNRHPILRYEYNGYKRSTREDIQKYQSTFAENWKKAVGYRRADILPNGKMAVGEYVSKHTDYYPIELE